MKRIVPFLILTACLFACNKPTKENTKESRVFGTMPDGTVVRAYTLANDSGISMEVISYGGIITKLEVPDRNGESEDIVLGFDNLPDYINMNPYFGAIIGRYGNRIANGKFSLKDDEYVLATNNGPNHLHGGITGFDKIVWDAETYQTEDGQGIRFQYLSPDGEEGYPGNVQAEVNYVLNNDNSLTFEYSATTDKATIINLTQHTYFNLTGMYGDVLGHELQLNSDAYLPVDGTLIPTGEIAIVEGTPFDFKESKAIGRDIHIEDEQLSFGNGFDHCWVINRSDEEMNLAASLFDKESGRRMEVFTTEPGVQFYSGNFLDGTVTGKYGIKYEFRSGLCLETQHYPDSPNQPRFPSVVLNPGEKYQSATTLKFSIMK